MKYRRVRSGERFFLVDLDQYYTKQDVAAKCVDSVDLSGYDIILEPSAGDGAFFNLLPSSNRAGLDLDPKIVGIEKADFLDYKPIKDKKYLVIGNPPFGKNSSLAKKFFNHSAEFADTIAFIVPRTFRKTATQNQLNLNFHLVEETILDPNSFRLDTMGEIEYSVPCVFQVWKKKGTKREKVVLPLEHEDFEFLTSEDYDADSLLLISIKTGGEKLFFKPDGKANVTLKFEEEEHSFECESQAWESFKQLQKQLPSFLFNSYKTKQVKRQITWKTKPDFVFRRAGAQAGKINLDYESCSLEGNLFIKANNEKVITIFNAMWEQWWDLKKDVDKKSIKWDTAGTPSVSKAELVQAYTQMKNNMENK